MTTWTMRNMSGHPIPTPAMDILKKGTHFFRGITDSGPQEPGGLFQPDDRPQTGEYGRWDRKRDRMLYAKGMSNSDVEEQIREVYYFEVSTSTISRITEKVAGDIVAWQNRPLEPVYLIVWMDGVIFKVRENSKVVNKTVDVAVGLRRDGRKEVLGL